jgi:hypothetical protein
VYAVPDGVTSPQSNPLGNGSVLLLSSGELLLGAEGLVALYYRSSSALVHHKKFRPSMLVLWLCPQILIP